MNVERREHGRASSSVVELIREVLHAYQRVGGGAGVRGLGDLVVGKVALMNLVSANYTGSS